MKDLFKDWIRVSSKIKRCKYLLLLLDFDGTLCKIVKHPKLVKLDEKTKSYLKLLSCLPNVSLGVITGRPLKEIKSLVRIKNIFYIGNHGFEIELFDKKSNHKLFVYPQAKKSVPLLKKIARDLKKELKDIKGLLVENKIFSLSLHYRMVRKKDIKEAKGRFSKIIAAYRDKGKIKITYGKKVIEIRPPLDWDKGKALLKIKDLLKKEKSILTIYLGDDKTDEDVFRVLEKSDIGIYIGGKGKSQASHRIKQVKEVSLFLRNLYELRVGKLC